MADQRTDDLPEGTDIIIEGAANSSPDLDLTSSGRTTSADTTGATGSAIGGTTSSPAGATGAAIGGTTSTPAAGIGDRFRSGREQLSTQAGEKARGLVGQGLERTSEALANVSKMVGDTASGIEERLGTEYGDYARRAASAIENVANSLAEKDPDELIDDARTFVRNSPGVALAGAAVVGFVLARLVKGGLSSVRDDDNRDDDD